MSALLRPPLLGALMVAGALLAALLKPSVLLADQLEPLDLARMVPQQIGGWKMVSEGGGLIVDPGQRELIQTIYTQTLNRAYRDSKGYLVMLSIAYGRDQRDALQVHRPEVCYPAQGFVLHDKRPATLAGLEAVPLTQMETQMRNRHEPVSYWTMIGDRPYSGSLAKKLYEIRYGIAGVIPDGMLVRVSSIDADAENAYGRQRDFALALVASLPPEVRPRFAGRQINKGVSG
ncbi:MAG TPA: EpsI family protein [Roseateles sp.]|jgi:EpsI family protein|nr:EpsI family protein [Roseateles sp.]HWT54247.1 EpsI family protein [Rhodocyclaceae bacterium]